MELPNEGVAAAITTAPRPGYKKQKVWLQEESVCRDDTGGLYRIRKKKDRGKCVTATTTAREHLTCQQAEADTPPASLSLAGKKGDVVSDLGDARLLDALGQHILVVAGRVLPAIKLF